MLVEQSQKRGKLDADDARLLQGVFEFSEKSAREVMTPRTEMVALPADLTLEEAADQVAVAGRSRYPVYGESLDDILGVVHAKDILAGVRSAKGGGLRAVVRPAMLDRKSTRLNSSHTVISYAVFCLKKKKKKKNTQTN